LLLPCDLDLFAFADVLGLGLDEGGRLVWHERADAGQAVVAGIVLSGGELIGGLVGWRLAGLVGLLARWLEA
jgi:hypothetical protein